MDEPSPPDAAGLYLCYLIGHKHHSGVSWRRACWWLVRWAGSWNYRTLRLACEYHDADELSVAAWHALPTKPEPPDV